MKAFLACVDRIECMVLKMLMILIGIVFNLKFKKFLNKLKEIPMDKYKLIQMVISKVYINSPPVDNEFDITIVYKFEES